MEIIKHGENTYFTSDGEDVSNAINEIRNIAKEEVKLEVERLRVELTETMDKYSQICERLWNIVHTK